jgi:DNA-binding LacI/PurR family transcriptional regulator
MRETARRPTLEDVAKAAGVSRALASIVIRDAPGASQETRARVLEIASRLGYRPDARARMLARSSTRLLGVTYRIGALHHADLLGPIHKAADALGFEVILSGKTAHHEERRALNTLLGYRCDALLLIAPELTEPELNQYAASIPTVVLGRRIVRRTVSMDVVRTDEHAGMGLAVEHLVGLGHARIAHVDGGMGTMPSDRRAGYRAGMVRAGLRDLITIVRGGETGDAGRRAGGALLALDPRPTAVVCYNDESAWGVMRALADARIRVPDRISVVGYDASPLARMAPQVLTTVRQDAEAIGLLGVQLAVARLEGSVPGESDVVLQPTLVPGETTGPPPKPGGRRR